MIEIGETHHQIVPDTYLIPECDERTDRVKSRTKTKELPKAYPDWDESEWHGRNNAYLFDGDQTVLFETLSPLGRDILHSALDELLGRRELDYLVISHTDQPHCGNTKSVLERYPDCTLLAPEYGQPDELYHLGAGESVQVGNTLDVGDFEFEFIEAFFLDAAKSIWMYERTTDAVFTADWLMFPHTSNECLRCVDEIDRNITIEHLRRAHDGNFSWWKISDIETVHADIELIFEQWRPSIIAPTHGLTIRGEENVREYFDKMSEVVRRMNAIQRESMGAIEK